MLPTIFVPNFAALHSCLKNASLNAGEQQFCALLEGFGRIEGIAKLNEAVNDSKIYDGRFLM